MASSMESQLWERAAQLLRAQHRPCPGAGEQLAQQQVPKWNRSPPVQLPPVLDPHPRGPWSMLPGMLPHFPKPLSCFQPAAADQGAFFPLPSPPSLPRTPQVWRESSAGAVCAREKHREMGMAGGCSQPGCVPGRLWLYLPSQAPWEWTQGLPGAGGGAGAALDPWAHSRGVVFLPSSTAALTQEGICNAEKNLPPATRQRVGRERSWEQLCSCSWAPGSCSCPRACPGPSLALAASLFQIGSWRPSGYHAPRTELCPVTMQVMLCFHWVGDSASFQCWIPSAQ